MTFAEHITSEELAAHRLLMSRWMRVCKILTRATLAAFCAWWVAVLSGAHVLTWVFLGLGVANQIGWYWFGWHIDREQRRVMLALQADIDELHRQCVERLGKAEG